LPNRDIETFVVELTAECVPFARLSNTRHALPDGFGQTSLSMPQRRLIKVTETGDQMLLPDAVELSQLRTDRIGQLDQTRIPGQVERAHNITPCPRPLSGLLGNLCQPGLPKRFAQLVEARHLIKLVKLITPEPQTLIEWMKRLTQQLSYWVTLAKSKLLKNLQ